MVVKVLREHKVASPRTELDLVFPGPARQAAGSHGVCRGSRFGKVQVDCGFVNDKGKPKYSPHDFRHFAASILIDEGFPVKKIQEIMGHAKISMTMDVYGHLFKDNEKDHERLAALELKLVSGA